MIYDNHYIPSLRLCSYIDKKKLEGIIRQKRKPHMGSPQSAIQTKQSSSS